MFKKILKRFCFHFYRKKEVIVTMCGVPVGREIVEVCIFCKKIKNEDNKYLDGEL